MRWLAVLMALTLIGCEFVETTRDVGHKGPARINPYLAAERFLESYDYEIRNRPGWPLLNDELMMVVLPVSVLEAQGYVEQLEGWVEEGGHAVILLENGESYLSDWGPGMAWRPDVELPDAVEAWFEELGLEVGKRDEDAIESVTLEGGDYEVFMEPQLVVGGEGSGIATRTLGDGRVTAVADARPLRNRYIGDHQHAALLLRLTQLSPYGSAIAFVRGASLSFWTLLWERAWPAVVALVALVLFWLWRSFPRFGPLDSVDPESGQLAYDHHLGALGDFHWRLDKAEGLLRPLRDQLLERAQHLAFTSGQRDADLFELIATRAGLTRERVERAMTFSKARDPGSMTRLVADLQAIHLSIS